MSKPGFPQYSTHVYNYGTSFTDQFGNVYPGTTHDERGSYWRDKSGENTPGWPHNKRENNYMTVSFLMQNSGIGYHFSGDDGREASGTDSSAKKAGVDVWWFIDQSWPLIGQLYGEARAKVVNRLIGQVKNQKVNFAQAFAERKQTSDLIISSARRIAESFTALRRGNFAHAVTSLTGSSSRARGIKRVAGGIPEQWLALQYGWKPLLSDVYGSCEELADALGEEMNVLNVYGTGRSEGERTIDMVFGPTSENPDWHIHAKGTASGKSRLDYILSSDFGNSVSRTGLTNPAQLAWELLPYSFVVDWFLPVGNFLANLDYHNGLDFKKGWLTMKIGIDWKGTATNTSRYPNWLDSGGWQGGGFSCDVKYFQREALGGWPAVSFPHFKDPFSPTHVANALSLLATAFSSSNRIR